MDKVILTRDGYDKLLDELTLLKGKKRIEAARALETARAHGDLRENAEYDAAKENKARLEERIATLEDKLSRAQIVDPQSMQSDKAFLGANMKIKNQNTGDTVTYILVSQDEADFAAGKISVTSPIGKGLLGKGKGDVVEIKVPAGMIKLEVQEITYG
ncbi:MAG: transcription elongation factor GreA [Candidatus Omnitrophica bacterium CG12_big_fil_rev_8_21_14_0_65_50_5]|nr:MAG: transcription elongation factor GreA [Candidatus Omnitrophica bacterium CG12_big_fil_rev_8_21_14_0_65_50_5]